MKILALDLGKFNSAVCCFDNGLQPVFDRQVVDPSRGPARFHHEQITTGVKRLEAIGKQDQRIKRLMTIPGFGPRTAEILLACIAHPGAAQLSEWRTISERRRWAPVPLLVSFEGVIRPAAFAGSFSQGC